MSQTVKLFIRDLTPSRPRSHVDEDINKYLREYPDWEIQQITYNTRQLQNNSVREEALVVFKHIEPIPQAIDVFNDIFNVGFGK